VSTKIKLSDKRAELAQVESVLSELGPSNIAEKFSLAARRDMLSKDIGALEATTSGSANVILFFDGGPVRGSYGVDAAFSSVAVMHYEGFLRKVAKQRHGDAANKSRMLLTGVVPGSFGLELQEEHESIVDSPMNLAAEQANELIGLAFRNEAAFKEASKSLDGDSQRSMRLFLGTLVDHKATLRISTEKSELRMSKRQIAVAHERVSALDVSSETVTLVGKFGSALPYKRVFDFKPDNGRPIYGTISEALDPEKLLNWAMHRCAIKVEVTARVRGKYMLVHVDPAPPDDGASSAAEPPAKRKRVKGA
jgi:hypothetical protein